MTKSFSEILGPRYFNIPQRQLNEGECQTPNKKTCRLCFASTFSYDEEQKRKNSVLQEFWDTLEIGIPVQPLIISPEGRHYRTVSKRKAFMVNDRLYLGLIGVDDDTAKSFPMSVGECAIEPHEHTEVYAAVQEFLQRREYFPLAEEFNYVIVKGGKNETAVIFNMNHFSSGNRKEVNNLSKHLTKKVSRRAGVKSVFVFVDEERSKYYLSGNPKKRDRENRKPMQKIFGTDKLFHKVGEKKFLYSPLSFSQTNHSILELFTKRAKELLDVQKDDTLLDLYCGYGLFSICLADSVKSVLGIELSRSSINDAIDNARRNKASNCRFVAADITEDSLHRFLKQGTKNLKVLLDPPRGGTAEGVIEFLAEQQSEKILHIFCNADIMSKELERWKRCGYIPTKAQPFDMFPGTSEIEMMVELEKR